MKDKIVECATLIVKKYPITYRNLYANLETITIRYTNENDKKRLKEYGADSCYNCKYAKECRYQHYITKVKNTLIKFLK